MRPELTADLLTQLDQPFSGSRPEDEITRVMTKDELQQILSEAFEEHRPTMPTLNKVV